MDVAMPEMDGIQATRLIKQQYPDVKVLILTQHDDREYVGPLLQAGASGYVLKRSGGHEVILALRQVDEQGVYLAPSITRRVLEDYTHRDTADRDSAPPLTERERDVLRLVVEGKSNKEIAHQLTISPKTVSVHRSNIMSKLGLHNSVEMLRYVTQHHLFDLG
jgi:DNA-binding NarL/FixJ family response regulator